MIKTKMIRGKFGKDWDIRLNKELEDIDGGDIISIIPVTQMGTIDRILVVYNE